MKNHVWRPLWVALGGLALVLVARHFMVPPDFGVHGRNFTYGYHRQGSIGDWQAFPVSYRGGATCGECHPEKVEANQAGKHAIIPCENCHGPALAHPENPEKLGIDRSRDLCIRCHAKLAYPNNIRGELPGIDPGRHNPASVCSECHDPHKPDLEGMN